MGQTPKTRSKDKLDSSAAADVAEAFSDSFGGWKHPAKQAAALDTQCSFEPFCKGKVVFWISGKKKEYFCAQHVQEGAEPFSKKQRRI